MAAKYLSEPRTSHGERLLGEGSQAWGEGWDSPALSSSQPVQEQNIFNHISVSLHLLCCLILSTLSASSL